MHSLLNTQTVVIVGALAILLPVVSRIVSSPVTLFLISPVLLFLSAIVFLASSIRLGHYLDAKRSPARRNLSHASRPFAFSTPAAWQVVLTRSQWSHKAPSSFSPLYPESPAISSELNDILTMVIRDFVCNWYKDLSSSPSFPNAVSTIIHDSLERLLDQATAIDICSLVVKRILPKITAHVDQFRQSEVALRGAGLERRLTQSEELDLLLASRYCTNGGEKLHPAIDNLSTTFTKQTEEMHLRQLVEKALPFVLPDKDVRSKALRIVAREIVTCSVLYPVMEMLTDPDFWNRAIDQVAGAAIRQQKLITKVRNVLDAQSPRSQYRISTPITTIPTETITIRTDVRQFESFLRSISRYSSLLDARRLKNDIVGEIRRTRLLLASHEKEDWINGEKTEDVVAFLDRLYTAKRQVEKRIVALGGEENSRQSGYPEAGTKSGLTLRDVLRNPNSLSYFMEFMDRRNRSLPVQFWLTVESFKNPLESVESGSSEGEDEPINDPSNLTTANEDISMINNLYFSTPTLHPTLSSIAKKHVDLIRAFARGDLNPSLATKRRVRRSVLLAQKQIECDMEQDFDHFERSELWFLAVGHTDQGNKRFTSDTSFTAKGEISAPNSTPSSPQTSATSMQDQSSAPQILPRLESSPSIGPHPQSPPILTSNRFPSSISGTAPSHAVPRLPSSNIEVLMTPAPESSSESPRAPLFDDPEDEAQGVDKVQLQRMAAIQAALTDIIALERQDTEKPQSMTAAEHVMQDSLFDDSRSNPTTRRRGMFDDDNEDDDDDDTPEDVGPTRPGSFQLAAPGDLHLSYEITRLTDTVTNFQAQDAMLDNLIRKAELTGDTQELRLLKKSKSAMNRELRQLKFQKLQYEQQESANRLLSDRTKLSIVSSTVGEEEGKSVVRYLIEIQQLAPDGSFASGWVVARRYNEFLSMHNKLRDRYAMVRNLDFPGKRLVTALSGSFLDTRKAALEKYMQSLITIPVVCESEELRAFLSRESPFIASQPTSSSKGFPGFSGTDLVRNVYRSVAESIDDMFFGPSMLDVMIHRLTRQAAEFAGIVGSGVNDEDLVAQALKAHGKTASEDALMQLSGDLKPLEGETSTSTFSAPICDLVLAIFELNKKNNWLRRQAIVIILQQVLGGTIERKMRETVKTFFDETRILSFLGMFREALWQGGELKSPDPPRTAEEKQRTRDEANRKLSSLVPDLAANVIGRSNARRGARRIFAVLQNRRLNQHIAYTIIDEVFAALFPDAVS